MQPELPADPLRVLIVEDHDDTRHALSRFIRRRGHIVESASDLAEARILLSAYLWDVVFVDKNLPDGNGWDLVGDEIAGVAVAMSAAARKEDVHEAGMKARGVFQHLLKPFDLRAVDSILKHPIVRDCSIKE